MQVLSVASEVYPLIKTGGLADVAGALPEAVAAHGVTMRTLMPAYPAVLAKLAETQEVHVFDTLFGHPGRILSARHHGLDLLLVDCPALFDRPGGPYLDASGKDHPDNFRRFAALSLAAALIAEGCLKDWVPDLVHVHDWQAALTPVYLRFGRRPETPVVLTIHNIAFQGQFSADIFQELALPWAALHMDWIEYYGHLGFLKGGMRAADAITTVSPSYAEEILTPEFGLGLEGLLAARQNALSGIVNGIDTEVWNPATDPMIAAHYDAARLEARRANRKPLLDRFKLDAPEGPLFCVISRLTLQKGMDILAAVIPDIIAQGGSLAVLGSGDAELEALFEEAALAYPGRVGLVKGYDEPLSHQLQAGADAILIPSRFEPCGLTQLYGLRYGCVPIVARTGGLADTIIDANEAAMLAQAATGFLFSPVGEDAFKQALKRAFKLFNEPRLWARLQVQGMKTDVSWDASAGRYAALYSQLCAKG
ncbi:starch synthase [Rhizobium rhizosphaerae]|uniref:Glycogen synthase n=1 Tax=Xaviernesmea rhizosphaerae TaxID=1672749 RepID=A0A1Q9AF28_9HYPH|nr:glycogen synthase GlgA [Xaviernesmea rhizosphaerae]OLP53534.1 starch synthase [Xaviernesmea rhizosphaerae]